jgi:hypothetical protein
MFVFIFGVLGICLGVLAFIRIEVIDRAIGKRIEEVFASEHWYKYDIQVSGTYAECMWDLRKWKYRDIFPEVVK